MEGSACDVKLQWLDPHPSSLGTFFINKVQLNSDGQQTEPTYWEPPHLANTTTKILSFEELVPTEGLERALVVNSCKLSEVLEDCFYFLPQTNLTVVCFPETAECPSTLERTIKVCPNHKTTQFTFLEGAVSGTVCGCHDCARLTIIHSPNSRKVRTKLLILRYKDFLRIIIPSGNLGSIFWQKLGLFGWYIDIKYRENVADAGDSEPSPKPYFEGELREFLGWLKVHNVNKWLDNADFEAVSPAVHLVGGTPQWGSKKLGGTFLVQLIQSVRTFCKGWKRSKYIQSHAVNHHFDEVKKLLQLDLNSKGSFKMIFPSTKCIEKALKSTPNLTVRELDLNTNLKYLDNLLNLKNFLHNPDDCRALPYANVYMETFHQADDKERQREVLGWFLFGSQTFGNMSWGVKEKIDRHELGVAIVPYVKDNILHAVNLAQIGFHFSLEPPAYDRTEFPTVPKQQIYRCQGQIVDYPGKRFNGSLFVANIPEAEKYQLNCLPSFEEKRSILFSVIYHETWKNSFDDLELAHHGAYLDFLCQLTYQSHKKQWSIRVVFVISAHKKFSALLKSLGKEEEAIAVAEKELSQPEIQRNERCRWSGGGETPPAKPLPKSTPKLSYHRQKFKDLYGEGSEEDFERYWTEQFENTFVSPSIIPNGSYQNYKPEREFDVRPWTSKMDDTLWMERQVCKMCNPLPKLIGQFSVPYLMCNFSMLGHKMFPGLENIEKAAAYKD